MRPAIGSDDGIFRQPIDRRIGPIGQALPRLLLLTALFFTTVMAQIMRAPLLPAGQTELVMDHSGAGHLFFVLSSSYGLSLLGTAHLTGRFQHRTLILAATAGLGLDLFTATVVEAAAGLRGTALPLGLATGLHRPSGINVVTRLTCTPHGGRALAIHELASHLLFPLGGGCVPVIIGWLGDAGLFGQAFLPTGSLMFLGAGLAGWLPPLDRGV